MSDSSLLSILVHGVQQPAPPPGTRSSRPAPLPQREDITPPPNVAPVNLTDKEALNRAALEQHRNRVREISRQIGTGERIITYVSYQAVADPETQDSLSYIWKKFYEDGNLGILFPDRTEYSYPDFVNIFNNVNVGKLIFLLSNPDGGFPLIEDIVGIALWTYNVSCGFKRADVSTLFLSDYWDRRTTDMAARLGLRFWFHELAATAPDRMNLDIARAYTAEGNLPIQKFMARTGWHRMETIPEPMPFKGELYRTVPWYITPDMFDADPANAELLNPETKNKHGFLLNTHPPAVDAADATNAVDAASPAPESITSETTSEGA